MLPQEVLWHSPKAQNGTGQYARAAVARHARARKPECWIFELNGRGSIPDRHRPTNIVKKENTRITGSTLYPVSSARSARSLVLPFCVIPAVANAARDSRAQNLIRALLRP